VIGETIKAKKITEPKPGVYVVDFGQNFAGHVRLKLNEPAGTQVRIRYSERLDKDGMIERSQIEQFMAKQDPPQPFQTDTYVCRGGGESWEQRFSYSGFRYAEVTGVVSKPSLDNFEGRFAHTDLESAGSFSCSDETLNKIQQAIRYSYFSNAQSIPTDCPQREKNGWTGDAQLAAEAGLMNFRSASFYTKWLDDLADTETDSGMMSVIVPTGGWGRGARHPAWDSAYPIVAFDLYRYLNDKTALAKHYDGLKRYVDSLAGELKDGVLTFDSLGDWLPWQTETPSTFSSTVYLYVDADILRRAAAMLGKSDDEMKYERLKTTVSDGVQRHFYANGTYANGSQTALSMALYFTLAPPELRIPTFNALVRNVTSQGHIDTGILGAKYLLRVLSEGGRSDLAYQLVARKEQPSWAWWIGQGATTLWEDWKGESSLNHIMFGDVSNWFYQWIAGIGLDEAAPGFSHIEIHPQVVGGLTWAKAEHQSPHGKIVSSWRLDGDGFHLDVTIPANAEATVAIPFGGQITEGGKPLRDLPGVRFRESGPSRIVFEIGSGTYSFLARRQP
jgi:alpha-L-rhamnosidase